MTALGYPMATGDVGFQHSGFGLVRVTHVHDGAHQQFTSKERDSESGLDYFGARYMSSAQGVSPAQTQVPLD